MKRIAVTGGIASGKSAFAQILGECGAEIIDYDQIARDILRKDSAGLAAVAKEFGTHMINNHGELDRKALAKIVFSNSESREKLNRITHPLIAQQARRIETQILHTAPDVIVIHDIPLFAGSWLEGNTDWSVLVAAPEEKRIFRMIHDRGMSETDAKARIRAQAADTETAKHVDCVIENTGSLEELRRKARRFWKQIGGKN
ncbi:dephospho-CoA kinase [Arcanobacterium hippocoleae]